MQQFQPYIRELYYRILIGFIAFVVSFIFCYIFKEQLYQLLLIPLINNMEADVASRIIYTGLAEALFTYLKVCLYFSFFLLFPFIIYQIYAFISPALYKKELVVFRKIMLMSPILFWSAILFVYYIIFPIAWEFFLSFQGDFIVKSNDDLEVKIPLELEAKISEYLSLSLQLILAFALAFQTPIILISLVSLGVITVDSLRRKRKLAVIIILCIAAIITPPDIITQILVALPMMVLYEISIIFSLKKKNDQQSEM